MRHQLIFWFSTAVLLVVVAVALISLVWTPYPLTFYNTANIWSGSSSAHLLGTDGIGRDQLSWLMAGSITALEVSLSTAIFSALGGLTLSFLIAARWRFVSDALASVVDMLIAFPTILLAMIIAALAGGSLWTVIISCSFAYSLNIARINKPTIKRLTALEFTQAAAALGSSKWAIMLKHIGPNILPLTFIQVTLAAGTSLLAESGLTYLGYGAPADTPSWGQTLANAQKFIASNPTCVVWPGLLIALTTLAFYLLGDSLAAKLQK